MTRISLAEEYDNRDMVAQMIALKNRQTESENTLVTYVAQCAQSASDAEDAKDAAVAAKDTAVSTVSDCVKMTPAAAQTITAHKLTTAAGLETTTMDATGNVTVGGTLDVTGAANIAGTLTSSGGMAISGGAFSNSEIRIRGGTAVSPLFKLDAYGTNFSYFSATNNDRTATFTIDNDSCIRAATPSQSANTTALVNIAYVSDTGGTLNNLVHTSGAESIAGTKTFTSVPVVSGGKDTTYLKLQNSYLDNPAAANAEPMVVMTNSNGDRIGGIYLRQNSNGTHVLRARIRNSDGTTYTEVDLATST